MTDHEAGSPKQGSKKLAADIRRTRRELATTVSALVEKTDWRRQSRRFAARARDRIRVATTHARGTASVAAIDRRRSRQRQRDE